MPASVNDHTDPQKKIDLIRRSSILPACREKALEAVMDWITAEIEDKLLYQQGLELRDHTFLFTIEECLNK